MPNYKRKPTLYTTPNLGIEVVSEAIYPDSNGLPRVMCNIRPHPMVTGTLVARARIKMADKLERKLLPSEIVHHKNEASTTDDRLSNLKLLTRGQHQREHRIGTKQSAETIRKKTAGIKRAHARGDFRHVSHAGESSGAAKLLWCEVEEIRRLRAAGHKNRELAEKFNVSIPTISMIANNRIWRKAR